MLADELNIVGELAVKTQPIVIPCLIVALSCSPLTTVGSSGSGEDTTSSADTAQLGKDRHLSPPGSEYRQEKWVFDHYKPRTGKILGVWPDSVSSTRLRELYSTWGFRGVVIDGNTYGRAVEVGFQPSDMMLHVNRDNYQYVVQNYEARAYYLGEPIDHACYGSPPYAYDELEVIGRFIRSYNRQFVIDGYRRCGHFIDAGRNVADRVMFSSYKHWFDVDPFGSECWTWTSEDQRRSWSDMQTLFGSRFMSVWISGYVNTSTCGVASDYDGDEYETLIGHAANVGLQEIWFFIGCGTNDVELTKFTDMAWRKGWLRRFERRTYIVYECTCSEGCISTPPGGCWRQVRTEETDALREVFPQSL